MSGQHARQFLFFAQMRELVLSILFSLILNAHALSEGEKSVVGSLLLGNPYLSLLSPPWTSNSSLACEEPPFEGISCSDGSEKHITGLYAPAEFNLYFTFFLSGLPG